MYADIIVDISHEKLDKPFQYRVPESLEDKLTVGMCVQVPFGRGDRKLKGYCVGFSDTCEIEESRIKDIDGIITGEASVEDKRIALASFIRRNYGSTMIQALKTVLPAKQSVKRLEHRTVIATASREELISYLGECRRKKYVARARLIEALIEQPTIPYEWLTGKLGVSGSTIQSAEQRGILKIVSVKSLRNPVHAKTVEGEGHVLSAAQSEIVTKVLEDHDNGLARTYLLHGVTGSGKTEVYMKLAEEMVARGKQCIILIPEIALTYQTLLRFYQRFGDRVSVMNSTLSPGEKYDQCERAKNGEIDVIIGPRSALFTPFNNVGLIVMDEEHESSYKSESMPRYHARETAVEAARLHGASVLLGSATPSMEAFYRAQKGEYGLFTLKERLTGGELPTVHVVDLREELKSGNRSVFSRKLQELLADRLAKGEQSMLFLNRRGYAGFLSCRACGKVLKCPHCDVSLSEHKGGVLLCHYCGYTAARPTACPSCGSKYLMGFRAGTQQIEDKLKELFPGIRTLRMDGDTTKKKDSYEQILSAFSEGEADVLIGTQMIVKGHDFPKVTLVGVLAADLSLSVGDYRAGERTFQLLTQAVGRAGRGAIPGEAVIQTYQPDHYAVVHAAAQDYESFYEEEILYREMMAYPPAAHMLAVQILSATEKGGMELAKELSNVVKRLNTEGERNEFTLLGPGPAAISRINDIYRFAFYVKHEKYERLIDVKDALEERIAQIAPRYENVQFDFDPVHTL